MLAGRDLARADSLLVEVQRSDFDLSAVLWSGLRSQSLRKAERLSDPLALDMPEH